MAFFKLGSDTDAKAATSTRASAAGEAETVEVLRRRARQRLIGATLLVLAGIVGFPLLFDSQPRPVAVDIPIDIPDKNKVAPLPPPTAKASAAKPSASVAKPVAAPAAPTATASAAKVADASSLGDKEEIVSSKPAPAPESIAQTATKTIASTATKTQAPTKPEVKTETKAEAKTETKTDAKADPKADAKTVAKPAAKPDEANKAKSLLEGQSPASVAAASAAGRFIVQVGAFADVTKARETRLKVERAGLKTYTQVVQTSEGERIRVRVGPFSDKAQADKAASTIKGLDLPAAILSL